VFYQCIAVCPLSQTRDEREGSCKKQQKQFPANNRTRVAMKENLKEYSDSIGGDYREPENEDVEFLHTGPVGSRVVTADAIVPNEEHKFVDVSLNLDYAYGLEPVEKDGETYYQYGLEATKKAKAINYRVDGFILHHTSSNGSFQAILNYISKVARDKDGEKTGQFGYHFLVNRDGRITQAAPLNKRTNHIKPGSKSQRVALHHLENHNTIGVSLYGGYRTIDGINYHQPAPRVQLDAAYKLIVALGSKYDVSLERCWGHGDRTSRFSFHESVNILIFE